MNECATRMRAACLPAGRAATPMGSSTPGRWALPRWAAATAARAAARARSAPPPTLRSGRRRSRASRRGTAPGGPAGRVRVSFPLLLLLSWCCSTATNRAAPAHPLPSMLPGKTPVAGLAGHQWPANAIHHQLTNAIPSFSMHACRLAHSVQRHGLNAARKNPSSRPGWSPIG